MFLVAQRKTREGLSIEDGNLRSKSLSWWEFSGGE